MTPSTYQTTQKELIAWIELLDDGEVSDLANTLREILLQLVYRDNNGALTRANTPDVIHTCAESYGLLEVQS